MSVRLSNRSVARAVIAVTFACITVLFAKALPPNLLAAPSQEQPPVYGITAETTGALSSASCSAAACHGGQTGMHRGEYRIWAPDWGTDQPGDPHSKAYAVLFNQVSTRIATALKLDKPAYESVSCLRCHSSETVEPVEARSEGVGCAGCHGAAEKWLNKHHQPAWKKLTHREKWEEYGFIPNRNLTARAMNCASCHVGDPNREVNHELYAAGHPRMSFEFAGLHAAPGYRAHWVETLPKADFEVRSWLIGQVVAARAACVLLEARATRATDDRFEGDWPDFAGQSCASCHQSLRKSPNDSPIRSRLSRGASGWELLSVSLIPVAAEYTPKLFAGVPAPRVDALNELRLLMSRNEPDPQQARLKCRTAIDELDHWLATLQKGEDDPRTQKTDPMMVPNLMRSIAANALNPEHAKLRDVDPDFLAAHAAGLSALNRAAPQENRTEMIASLTDQLPVPHTKNGRLVNWRPTPTGTRTIESLARFQSLFEQIQRPGATK